MAANTDAPTALATDEPSGGGPAPVESSRELTTLQNQLREKDQIVSALTERLEQAAEQLDRLRRTGADKGLRPLAVASAGAGPAWLAEHKETFDDLKRLVADWDQIQPGSALTRIVEQLAELRDLVSGSGSSASPGGSNLAALLRSTPTPAPAKAPAPAAAPAPKADPHSKGPNNSWWEAQKAAMLGDAPPEEGEPQAQTVPEAAGGESADPGSTQTTELGPRIDLASIVIAEPPAPVDFTSLTLDEAKQAIRDRDAVIQQLREPLLLLRAAGQLPQDLQSLDQLPEVLRQRLGELEAQWQSKFRQIELELSLERARLARDQAHLRQQQELLQKQLKQGGQFPKEAPDGVDKEDHASRRRWFRFMGKPGDENKGDQQ